MLDNPENDSMLSLYAVEDPGLSRTATLWRHDSR
jgi:hypothetical protein